MCKICRCTPCAALCPNADPLPVVGKCAICGEDIYKGDDIYTNGNEAVHAECRKGYTVEELLSLNDLNVTDPIRYADDPDSILNTFGFERKAAE